MKLDVIGVMLFQLGDSAIDEKLIDLTQNSEKSVLEYHDENK